MKLIYPNISKLFGDYCIGLKVSDTAVLVLGAIESSENMEAVSSIDASSLGIMIIYYLKNLCS